MSGIPGLGVREKDVGGFGAYAGGYNGLIIAWDEFGGRLVLASFGHEGWHGRIGALKDGVWADGGWCHMPKRDAEIEMESCVGEEVVI